MSPTLLRIHIGRAATRVDEAGDNPWTSAIVKSPVTGSIRLGSTGLDGDEQADRSVHGGPDKAVLAYSADHYPAWRQELGIEPFEFGAFGENFTVAGLTESTVCVGDDYVIGDARVQVSQQRQPCWKLARRCHFAKALG